MRRLRALAAALPALLAGVARAAKAQYALNLTGITTGTGGELFRVCCLSPVWLTDSVGFCVAAYTVTVAIGTVDSSGSSSSVRPGSVLYSFSAGGLTRAVATHEQNEFRLIADTGSSNDAVLGAGCCGDSAVGYSCSASSTCSSSTSGSSFSLSYASASISCVPVFACFLCGQRAD